MTYYTVTHLTIYKYSVPITDSVMEIRKQPRTDSTQRNLRFDLEVSPTTLISHYDDYLGNSVHHFNIPIAHDRMAIKATAIVEVKSTPDIPPALEEDAWDAMDAVTHERNFYDMLLPGEYTAPSALLEAYAQEINLRRHSDPLTVLRELNQTLANDFVYEQHITRVDSPIDDALKERRGVCQDFAHIMLVLVRRLGIPARYVSGYLFHRHDHDDRSDEDASHAWIEAWLPDLGWIGFDPTNNLIVGDRHIRVCIGRDYADAAPSKGVFKGDADTELQVQVAVKNLDEIPPEETLSSPNIALPNYGYQRQQQQQ